MSEYSLSETEVFQTIWNDTKLHLVNFETVVRALDDNPSLLEGEQVITMYDEVLGTDMDVVVCVGYNHKHFKYDMFIQITKDGVSEISNTHFVFSITDRKLRRVINIGGKKITTIHNHLTAKPGCFCGMLRARLLNPYVKRLGLKFSELDTAFSKGSSDSVLKYGAYAEDGSFYLINGKGQLALVSGDISTKLGLIGLLEGEVNELFKTNV